MADSVFGAAVVVPPKLKGFGAVVDIGGYDDGAGAGDTDFSSGSVFDAAEVLLVKLNGFDVVVEAKFTCANGLPAGFSFFSSFVTCLELLLRLTGLTSFRAAPSSCSLPSVTSSADIADVALSFGSIFGVATVAPRALKGFGAVDDIGG